MLLGGGAEAGAEVEAVIETELHGDVDAVGAERDEDSVWLGLKVGKNETDVGVDVAAAVAVVVAAVAVVVVVFVAVILADAEAGRWRGPGSGEVGGAGG